MSRLLCCLLGLSCSLPAFGQQARFKGCTDEQQGVVESALDRAKRQVFPVWSKLGRLPPGSKLTGKVRKIGLKLLGDDFHEVAEDPAGLSGQLQDIRGKLMPVVDFVCVQASTGTKTDRCQGKPAYFDYDHSDIYFLCDGFFGGSDEDRTVVIMREAIHHTGMYADADPATCPRDCKAPCPGTQNELFIEIAENWSRFISCVRKSLPGK